MPPLIVQRVKRLTVIDNAMIIMVTVVLLVMLCYVNVAADVLHGWYGMVRTESLAALNWS